jgi:hypothetical protein
MGTKNTDAATTPTSVRLFAVEVYLPVAEIVGTAKRMLIPSHEINTEHGSNSSQLLSETIRGQ